jgi:hypothetical protein
LCFTSLRTILAPILPKPIMASFMCVSSVLMC